jgi:hypothetical protein
MQKNSAGWGKGITVKPFKHIVHDEELKRKLFFPFFFDRDFRKP